MLNALDNDNVCKKDLLRLLVNQDMKVYYQAITNPNTQELISVEALSRLHSGGETLLPGSFIDHFINKGIATQLDAHVIKSVAEHISMWGANSPMVNINFSLDQFKDLRMIERMKQLLSNYGVSPELIKIEVTEGQKITDFKSISRTLSRLRDVGFTIVLDDFGKGYSTLRMLKGLPAVQEVKLDKFFINDLSTDRDRDLVSQFGSFTQNLGYKFIVEGIETEQQLEFLKGIGVDGVQGFLIHRPEQLVCMETFLGKNLYPQ